MKLYQPVHTRLCRYVQALIWNSEDARDLIGEVTLLAYEKFDNTQPPDTFVYYLFGIARNLYLKKCRRDQWKGVWHADTMEEQPAWQEADSSLKRRELAILLSKLSEKHRTALSLFEVAGFSYDEIARLMNTSSGNVKSMLSRSRQQLKAFVEQDQKMRLAQQEPRPSQRLAAEGGNT